ncbi:MAG: methionine--tRNA ligase [Acidimicrobiia bacterium]
MTRYLVTSALPYINGVKHLGNLVGSMLPADVYARYLRQRGDEVLAICATDEHGTPAELAALAARQSVETYCAEQHEIQKRLGERWGLAWDQFGRTSSSENRQLTQHFANALMAQGFLEERVTKQIFSVDDDRFLPDRYVEGTCPHCGYERARGDQCENCTRVLDPTDLVNPRSAVSGSTNLEVRESKHLFLLQSKLADRIRAWVDTRTEWPQLTKSIAYKWLDEGLTDRGITRDLKWGVPVPFPGFEDKVFYVWFDAPIGYIGATAEWGARHPLHDWRTWWLDADDVEYVQFMGKDNVPFHTVSFPATIIGSEEPWKLVDQIKSFNWLNWYGGKFSTSQGRGVFMDTALELLPADVWRYVLMANAPESDDTNFTWEILATSVNKDLAGNLGNFINRVLRFTSSKFGDEVPSGGTPGADEAWLTEQLQARLEAYTAHLNALQFRKAVHELRSIWALGNQYLDRTAPWERIKEDRDAAALALRTAINLARLDLVLSAPLMPRIAANGLDFLGAYRGLESWPHDAAKELTALPEAHGFAVPPVLFEKVTDEQIAAWSERFGT